MNRDFHEEQQFRQPWLMALLAAVTVTVVVAIASSQSASALGALVGIAAFALVVAFVLAVKLVVDVTSDTVTVSFRYLWPTRRVAISDIRSFESVRYRPLIDYLGYGVRFGPKGLAYNVSGDRGVRIQLRDGGTFLIGSQRPDELAAAIARAKGDRGSA